MSARIPLKLAIVADGPPNAQATNSGVAAGLAAALARRADVQVVGLLDGRLRGPWAPLAAILTVRPNRRSWRARYTKSRMPVWLRTRMVDRDLRRLGAPPDYLIQLRNVYGPAEVPYVPFLDNTAMWTQGAWPPWALPAAEYSWRIRADRRQFRNAAHVLTAGKYLADHLIRDYNIDATKVTAIGGGINFDSERPAVRPQKRGPRDPFRILFVGTEFERKGGDLLLAAFSLLRAERPQAELLIVGAEMPEKIAGVTSHGVVRSRAVLSDLYARSNVFCLPVRFEPYGLVLQEAMFHSLPVVATKIQAIPEIVQDGQHGLLVPRDDVHAVASALRRLCDEPTVAEAMGLGAREHVVTALTWDQVAGRLVAALRPTEREK